MRLIACFSGLALLVLATWMLWGGAWELRFTGAGAADGLADAGRWAWLAGIGLLAADLVLPVPGTLVMSALGFLYGPAVGGLAAAVGSMLSGLCGYGIGRVIGEKAARKLLGDRDFEKGRILFAAGGTWWIALSRALPILPEALSCTAGLVRMPFARFCGALACGSLPVGFLFAWIGAAGQGAPGWAMVLSMLVPAILWFIARRVA